MYCKSVYKKTQFLHLPPPGGLIIGGSRVEHDTNRNGPVPAGRITPESSNLMAVSLAFLSKTHKICSMSVLHKVHRQRRQNHQKYDKRR